MIDVPYSAGALELSRCDTPDWRCQTKVDGWRVIATVDETGRVGFMSRQKNDISRRVSSGMSRLLAENVPPSSILDGELIDGAIVFFDVLAWGGGTTLNRPYDERYSLLPIILDRPEEAEQGGFLAFYDRQIEGVVLKLRKSLRIGRRNPFWKKIRHADDVHGRL